MNRIPKDKSPGRDLRNNYKNWNLEINETKRKRKIKEEGKGIQRSVDQGFPM